MASLGNHPPSGLTPQGGGGAGAICRHPQTGTLNEANALSIHPHVWEWHNALIHPPTCPTITKTSPKPLKPPKGPPTQGDTHLPRLEGRGVLVRENKHHVSTKKSSSVVPEARFSSAVTSDWISFRPTENTVSVSFPRQLHGHCRSTPSSPGGGGGDGPHLMQMTGSDALGIRHAFLLHRNWYWIAGMAWPAISPSQSEIQNDVNKNRYQFAYSDRWQKGGLKKAAGTERSTGMR